MTELRVEIGTHATILLQQRQILSLGLRHARARDTLGCALVIEVALGAERMHELMHDGAGRESDGYEVK